MIAPDAKDRNTRLGEYLQLLRLLAFELDRAIQAIAQNSLSVLEDSVQNQEAFSTRLAELADDLWEPELKDPASRERRADAGLMREIVSASNTVHGLNRRYAVLIRLSSQSVTHMVSLFRSFQGQITEGSGAGLKHQTWSCRI